MFWNLIYFFSLYHDTSFICLSTLWQLPRVSGTIDAKATPLIKLFSTLFKWVFMGLSHLKPVLLFYLIIWYLQAFVFFNPERLFISGLTLFLYIPLTNWQVVSWANLFLIILSQTQPAIINTHYKTLYDKPVLMGSASQDSARNIFTKICHCLTWIKVFLASNISFPTAHNLTIILLSHTLGWVLNLQQHPSLRYQFLY